MENVGFRIDFRIWLMDLINDNWKYFVIRVVGVDI